MKYIVGLGNPGTEYDGTRHNFGYNVVDAIATQKRLRFSPGNGTFLHAINPGFMLFKPLTFMNNSGVAVEAIVSRYVSRISDLLVVLDDIDLELGRIRLRKQGESGGHRGLDSIIRYLGRDDFPRLRLGVGPQPDGVASEDWVLARFKHSQQNLVKNTIDRAVSCVYDWMKHGIDHAMNMHNRKMAEENADH